MYLGNEFVVSEGSYSTSRFAVPFGSMPLFAKYTSSREPVIEK